MKKLIIKDIQKAKEVLGTNRPVFKGMVLKGDPIKLSKLFHTCPDAFEDMHSDKEKKIKAEYKTKEIKPKKKTKKRK